jgi:uncharacterized membrane protein (DUF106 family)
MNFKKPLNIFLMSLFSIVMILTGSLLINMYRGVSSGKLTSDTIEDDATFHWYVGLISVLVGVFCIMFSVYHFLNTRTMKNVREALLKKE